MWLHHKFIHNLSYYSTSCVYSYSVATGHNWNCDLLFGQAFLICCKLLTGCYPVSDIPWHVKCMLCIPCGKWLLLTCLQAVSSSFSGQFLCCKIQGLVSAFLHLHTQWQFISYYAYGQRLLPQVRGLHKLAKPASMSFTLNKWTYLLYLRKFSLCTECESFCWSICLRIVTLHVAILYSFTS